MLDDENILDDYHATFKKEISLSPQGTEEILQCTKSERVRWTAEGKLPVVYHEDFHKFGKDLKCPYYDRVFICKLTPAILDEWRTAHKEKVLVIVNLPSKNLDNLCDEMKICANIIGLN